VESNLHPYRDNTAALIATNRWNRISKGGSLLRFASRIVLGTVGDDAVRTEAGNVTQSAFVSTDGRDQQLASSENHLETIYCRDAGISFTSTSDAPDGTTFTGVPSSSYLRRESGSM
jgi:hypothetical protein